MRPISYSAPRSLAEAVSILADHGERARVLAGGTDLIVQLRENTLSRRLGGADPDTIVDVKNIPELTELRFDPQGGLVIGAAVACSRLYEDAVVARHYPGIVDAVALIGSIQIQNRASLGGNLCNGSSAADGIPPLIAQRAKLSITGKNGTRLIDVEDFCTGPGRTQLQAQELLVSISLPPPLPRAGANYLRFIPRNEMDIAVVGVASWLELEADGETIRDARVSLAAVAPTPLLVREATLALKGRKASAEAFLAAQEAARQATRPITDMRGEVWQRRHLAGVLTGRTLQAALERARKS